MPSPPNCLKPLERCPNPDRTLHAEEAIEPAFDILAARAEAMGWTRDETAHALVNLAVARILAIQVNHSTDDAIRQAVASVHGFKLAAR